MFRQAIDPDNSNLVFPTFTIMREVSQTQNSDPAQHSQTRPESNSMMFVVKTNRNFNTSQVDGG